MAEITNFTHKMTLYNEDISVTWHRECETVKITEVMFIHLWSHSNLIEFISRHLLNEMVRDIERDNNATKHLME